METYGVVQKSKCVKWTQRYDQRYPMNNRLQQTNVSTNKNAHYVELREQSQLFTQDLVSKQPCSTMANIHVVTTDIPNSHMPMSESL